MLKQIEMEEWSISTYTQTYVRMYNNINTYRAERGIKRGAKTKRNKANERVCGQRGAMAYQYYQREKQNGKEKTEERNRARVR